MLTASWQNVPDTAFPKLDGPYHCDHLLRTSTGRRIRTELDVFKLMIGDESTFIKVMADNLAPHKRKARSRPPTPREFWIIIGLKLCANVRLKPNKLDKAQGLVDQKNRLQSLLSSEDRRTNLLAALKLDKQNLQSILTQLTERWQSYILPGKFLVVDETILGSESLQAAKEGMLRYIEGKPHPKGYFFNAALQRFRHSRCVYILDLEIKLDFDSLGMGDALLSLIQRCEERSGKHFVVFADSGYPASRLLIDPTNSIKSKFVASVSVAKVSGQLRMLPEAFQTIGKLNQEFVLYNERLRLHAFIRRSKEFTQCLVTNLYQTQAEISVRPRMTYDQAICLATNFTLSELVSIFNLPIPTHYSSESNHMWIFLKQQYGVDLSSPVDSTGFVTRQSLTKLALPAIKEIANAVQVQSKVGMKKEAYIDKILAKHPKALVEEMPIRRKSGKRKHDDISPTVQAKNTKKELENLKVKLSTPTDRPTEFAVHYSASYGWQDRMNSLIYDHLHHQASPTPESKLFWICIFLPLVNAYGLWREQRLSELKTAAEKNRASAQQPPLFDFMIQVCTQLADWCEIMNEDGTSPISRRASLS